jgi:hypothetical protein
MCLVAPGRAPSRPRARRLASACAHRGTVLPERAGTVEEPHGPDGPGGRARLRGGAGRSPLARGTLARGTLALSGAWLPSIFGSAVLLPQQVEVLVGTPRWSAAYAAVSAAGWLTVALGLTLSGRLQDTGRIGGPGDRRTLPVLVLLTLVTGALLPTADTVPMLAVLWVAAMLPPAFAVTLLAARVARPHAPDVGVGVVAAASAIGAAPLLAMLVGSVVNLLAPVTGAGRSLLIAAVAAALLLLGAAGRDVAEPLGAASAPASASASALSEPMPSPAPLPPPLPPLTDPVVRSSVRAHARLLAGVALVDTGTVTLTFAIVPLVFLLPRAVVPDPGGYAELLVLGAAVGALLAVWIAPRLPGLRAAPRRLFLWSGLVVAVVLVVGPFVGPGLLAVVAVGAGLAVGASNAATFGVFLTDPASRERRATGLGLLNAMPSLPAVAVPLAAAPLLRSAPASGLTVVMLAAAALATAGALVVSTARREHTL